jgi:hypothetical protein
MSASARRGRNIILAILAIYFLLEFLTILFTFAIQGFHVQFSACFRVGLAIVLAYFLYAGKNWARLVWGGLFLFGELVILVLSFYLLRANPQPAIVVFFCFNFFYFLASAGLLFLSPDVRAYIDACRFDPSNPPP